MNNLEPRAIACDLFSTLVYDVEDFQYTASPSGVSRQLESQLRRLQLATPIIDYTAMRDVLFTADTRYAACGKIEVPAGLHLVLSAWSFASTAPLESSTRTMGVTVRTVLDDTLRGRQPPTVRDISTLTKRGLEQALITVKAGGS